MNPETKVAEARQNAQEKADRGLATLQQVEADLNIMGRLREKAGRHKIIRKVEVIGAGNNFGLDPSNHDHGDVEITYEIQYKKRKGKVISSFTPVHQMLDWGQPTETLLDMSQLKLRYYNPREGLVRAIFPGNMTHFTFLCTGYMESRRPGFYNQYVFSNEDLHLDHNSQTPSDILPQFETNLQTY